MYWDNYKHLLQQIAKKHSSKIHSYEKKIWEKGQVKTW